MQIGGIAPALQAVSGVYAEPGSMANTVGIKMLDNSLELNQAMSDSMIKMMENSVTPHLGSQFDMTV